MEGWIGMIFIAIVFIVIIELQAVSILEADIG